MGTKNSKEKGEKKKEDNKNSDLKGVKFDLRVPNLLSRGNDIIEGSGEFKDEYHLCNQCRKPIRSCPEVKRYFCVGK